MHNVHANILNNLRHRTTARFSELRRPTGMESDNFKFHVRKLVKIGLITKTDDGTYMLTTAGKAYANNLDDASPKVRKQIKTSMLLIISRQKPDGQIEYVLQERLRQPYMHYIGLLSGPIMWGEPAEVAARRECLKQTGLEADFSVRTVCRMRDYAEPDGELREDKLFIVLLAGPTHGRLANEWPYGHNSWLTLEAFEREPLAYASTHAVLEAANGGEPYITLDMSYDTHAY